MGEGIEAYRCADCGTLSSVFTVVCPRCASLNIVRATLSGYGTVRTFTIQNVAPDEFASEAPYAYVIVEMDEGFSVSGWMPEVRTASAIRIGDRVSPSGRRGCSLLFSSA